MKTTWRNSPPAKKVSANLYLNEAIRDAAKALAESKGFSLSDFVDNLLSDEIEIDRLEKQERDHQVVADLVSDLKQFPLGDVLSFGALSYAKVENRGGVAQVCYNQRVWRDASGNLRAEDVDGGVEKEAFLARARKRAAQAAEQMQAGRLMLNESPGQYGPDPAEVLKPKKGKHGGGPRRA